MHALHTPDLIGYLVAGRRLLALHYLSSHSSSKVAYCHNPNNVSLVLLASKEPWRAHQPRIPPFGPCHPTATCFIDYTRGWNASTTTSTTPNVGRDSAWASSAQPTTTASCRPAAPLSRRSVFFPSRAKLHSPAATSPREHAASTAPQRRPAWSPRGRWFIAVDIQYNRRQRCGLHRSTNEAVSTAYFPRVSRGCFICSGCFSNLKQLLGFFGNLIFASVAFLFIHFSCNVRFLTRA